MGELLYGDVHTSGVKGTDDEPAGARVDVTSESVWLCALTRSDGERDGDDDGEERHEWERLCLDEAGPLPAPRGLWGSGRGR